MRASLVLLFFFLYLGCSAQHWTELYVTDFPEPVTNNAVCEGFSAEGTFIYSFAGIDSTLQSSGIHLKSWRMNTQTLQVEALPNLPDTLGKIAAAASRVGNLIYIIGGYHVFPNGSELSSNKVHRFDIAQNQFLTDAAPLPVPIDDHVQAVYKDSLIYVVTGWSDNGNVPDVQIYNTYTNTWLAGTSTPNTNAYKCFGASGEIIGDTLYYFGGAAGFNFAAQTELRKGYINPGNPTEITWSETEPSPAITGYRSAACLTDQAIHWLGGSSVTYNFNAIAYNGSGLVAPANHTVYYHPNGNWGSQPGIDIPMDLRGVANITDRRKQLIGGIGPDGVVHSSVIELVYSGSLAVTDALVTDELILIPNPTSGMQSVKKSGHLSIYTNTGSLVYRHQVRQNQLLDISSLREGTYVSVLNTESAVFRNKLVVVK